VLENLAGNQPSSFLQIGDLAIDLTRQKDDAIAELKRVGADVQAEANRMIAQAKADAVISFRDDAPKAAIKTFGWAGVGLAVLGLAIAIAGWVKDHAFEDSKKIAQTAAEEALRDRITINAKPDTTGNVELRKQIQQLTDRLGKLEKRKP
jgi:hypothetical protein